MAAPARPPGIQPLNTAAAGSTSPGSPRAIKIFVGQVPKEWPPATIVEIFQSVGVTAFDVKPIVNPTTQASQGCAFVSVASTDEAYASIYHLHNKVQTAPGKWLQVRLAFKETGRLFVSAVGAANEAQLYDLFSKHGQVVSIHVVRKPMGDSKGCAIVEFATKDEAANAIAVLDDVVTLGGALSRMRVEWARSAQQQQQQQPSRESPRAHASSGWGDQSPRSHAADMNGGFSPQHAHQQPHAEQYFFPVVSAPAAADGSPQANGIVASPMSPTAPGMPFFLSPEMPAIFYPLSPTSGGVGGGFAPVGAAAVGAPLSPHMAYGQGFYLQPAPLYSPVVHHRPPATAPAVSPSSSPASKRFAEGPPGANLFVSGFSRDFTEDDMCELFSQYGSLLSWMIFTDKTTQRSKCFGFVSYDSVDAAERARVALNKHKIGNFVLYVSTKQGRGPPESPRSMQPGIPSPAMPSASATRKVLVEPPSAFKLEESVE